MTNPFNPREGMTPEERARYDKAMDRATKALDEKSPLEALLIVDGGIYMLVHLLGRLYREYRRQNGLDDDDTP